nr:DUF551 domain-containing protein [Klebsiella pneumoniae]
MTSKLTRERLVKIKSWREIYGAGSNVMLPAEEAEALALIALAAMDSEPVAWTWHYREQWHVTSDKGRAAFVAIDGDVDVLPLYRHAQPAVAVTDDELNAALQLHRLKVDGHSQLSDAFRAGFRYARRTTAQSAVESDFIPKNLDKALGVLGMAIPESREEFNFQTERWIQRLIDRVIRYADEFQEQPEPVVPEEMTPEMMRAVQLNSELGSYAAANLTDAYSLYREFWSVAIAAAPQLPGSEPATVPGKWIPVSERMPIEFEAVIAFDGDQVYGEAMYSSDDGFTIDGYDPCDRVQLQNVTHWMPLPAAPQEVR